jgi:hypothetical protein
MTFKAKVRIASTLWLILAVVVWNVVFDRIIVLAGRRYVYDANMSVQRGVYLPVSSAMPPAVRRGVWLASAVSLPIAIVGVAAVQLAARRECRAASSRNAPPGDASG